MKRTQKAQRTTPPSSAKGWHRRTPGVGGLFDNGDWTLAIGGSHYSNGSHEPYTIELIHRVYTPGAGAPKADGTRHDSMHVERRTFTVPAISWARAYTLRRFGALRLYRLQERALRWLYTI
jgi:hypothetical protein